MALRFLKLGKQTGDACRIFIFFLALMVIVASIFIIVVEYKLLCRKDTSGRV